MNLVKNDGLPTSESLFVEEFSFSIPSKDENGVLADYSVIPINKAEIDEYLKNCRGGSKILQDLACAIDDMATSKDVYIRAHLESFGRTHVVDACRFLQEINGNLYAVVNIQEEIVGLMQTANSELPENIEASDHDKNLKRIVELSYMVFRPFLKRKIGKYMAINMINHLIDKDLGDVGVMLRIPVGNDNSILLARSLERSYRDSSTDLRIVSGFYTTIDTSPRLSAYLTLDQYSDREKIFIFSKNSN